MNNDIKEIKTINQLLEYVETEERAYELIYYITNLQEENEKLKERVQIGQNAFLSLNSKIDKAIEYIKENFDKTGICVSGSDLPFSYIEELLEILGDDNEQ